MTTATYTSTMTDEQSRELGHHRGYNAANYAANVSGEPFDSLTPDYPLGLTDRQRMFYDDGYSSGIDEYQVDEYESDMPETS